LSLILPAKQSSTFHQTLSLPDQLVLLGLLIQLQLNQPLTILWLQEEEVVEAELVLQEEEVAALVDLGQAPALAFSRIQHTQSQ
jgi:hypothetical protein